MKTPVRQSEIIQRMRIAAGHLNAVIKMAEENETCEQILHQLHAVQAALNAVGHGLITCQIRDSQKSILESSSAEERLFELKKIQSLYTVFTRYSNYHTEVSHE